MNKTKLTKVLKKLIAIEDKSYAKSLMKYELNEFIDILFEEENDNE